MIRPETPADCDWIRALHTEAFAPSTLEAQTTEYPLIALLGHPTHTEDVRGTFHYASAFPGPSSSSASSGSADVKNG